MNNSELCYDIMIMNHTTNKSYKTSVKYPITLPDDIDVLKNPYLIEKQLIQDIKIQMPDFNKEGFEFCVLFTGEIKKHIKPYV